MDQPTILIIEDNDITRKMYRISLQVKNFRVLEAPDAKTALALLKDNKPDLILQDLVLPDMNGIELNQQLRKLPNGSDIPIIALSGFSAEMLKISNNPGFTSFLLKPIERDYLVEIVKSNLPTSSADTKQQREKKHILIVDDNEAQLKILRLHLIKQGYDVTVANNGLDALNIAKDTTPDLIVTDILMPKLDGFELCLEIRRDPKLLNMPVILQSSNYIEEQDQQLAKEVGANAYILREPNDSALIGKIDECLQHTIPITRIRDDFNLIKEEHTHRIIRQLERQVANNTDLAQRCALQAAQLALISGITASLHQRDSISKTLQEILMTTLDAVGISKGAIYLIDENKKPVLVGDTGYTPNDKDNLLDFFGHPEFLSIAQDAKANIIIPSAEIDDDLVKHILTMANALSLILIPLNSLDECYGILFLGSNVSSMQSGDSIDFMQNLAKQFGQSIALARTMDKLANSEQRYRNLMDNASCGIIVGSPGGVVIEVNKKYEEMLGRSRTALMNRDFRDFIPEEDREYAKNILRDLTRKKVVPGEIRMVRPDGEIRLCEFTAVPISIDNQDFVYVVANDVTEAKQLKAKALINDKLATVGTLAAGVAHEINNPIAWIQSNLDFLYHHINKLENKIDNTELKTLTKVIQESMVGTKRVEEIVKSLKDFSRADQEEATATDIHTTLESAISIATHEIKYRATLEKDFMPKMPLIMANTGQLSQVFLNIILNAAQAIPEGNVTNNKILVKTSLTSNNVVVSISDTGQGIPENIISKIFDPFFTTKPVGSGTGLGLYICHEIIRAIGGDIQVHSKPGKGTTFTIQLPINSQMKEAPKNETVVTAPIRRLKVLVIDDEELLLETLKRMLEEQHDVTVALGVEQALEVLEKNGHVNFDVILCDLNMPNRNGKDFYQAVSNKYPLLKSKIIFMTGGTYTSELKDFSAGNGIRHIDKPFSYDKLCQILKDF